MSLLRILLSVSSPGTYVCFVDRLRHLKLLGRVNMTVYQMQEDTSFVTTWLKVELKFLISLTSTPNLYELLLLS